MEAQTPTTSTTPPIEEHHAPSFFQKNRFTLITVAILLLALIPLLMLTRNSKKVAQTPTQTQTQNLTPTIAPLTTENAQPTLDAADQNIQNSINQADTEINAANQVDASQDSTTGL